MSLVSAGDEHGQWQALEGLGAVAFNEGFHDKAAKYFREALATLSKTEDNASARERIINKLSDALGSEANSETSARSYLNSVSLYRKLCFIYCILPNKRAGGFTGVYIRKVTFLAFQWWF